MPPVKDEAPVRARTSTVFTAARSSSTTEPAAKIVIVSMPPPPITVSAVLSAVASLKMTISLPRPALIVSMPPPPAIESALLPETMESPPVRLALPRMVSAPLPPTIDHPLPLAPELAVPSIQVGLEKLKMLEGLRL